jgi:enoyl-CoA hydratase/carnithine racemase
LLQLARDPTAVMEFSPLSAQPYLLFDASTAELSPAALPRLAAWLRELPCPSIGVAAQPSALSPLCDVLLEQAATAPPLLDNIRRSPIAAAVLVQLLRAGAALNTAQALHAESLAYATLQAGPEFRRWLQARTPPAPALGGDQGPAVVLRREDDVLALQLNRPSQRNAMSVEMRDALMEALQLALSDDSIRRLRLSGRGRCFSTGGELDEFGRAPDAATAHVVRSLALPGRLLAACAARVEARLHGACIGSGIEFPAFAGRVIASREAWFQLPELRYGLIPGAGGCVSIPRRIGRQRTAWLALSGRRIDAATALRWGLIDAIEDVGAD